ncbi:MAG: transcription antitermination factor NusB, partial [Acidobacteriota bacterium]
MGSPSPRDIACGILLRVSRGRDHASTLLRGIDDAAIAARDRALITELVNGVLRRRLYLDHVIEAYASRPLARIDAELIEVLRLALYQLLFLQRVPAHAAVNEAVRMAR